MPLGINQLWPAQLPPSSARVEPEPTLFEILLIKDWWQFVPETLIILASIYTLQIWTLKDSGAPIGMPHPFWIPVVLVSCQYGVMGGIFAALASTAAYLSTGVPPQTAAQDFYGHAAVISALPAGWLAVALLIGGLRSLQIGHVHELNVELAEMRTMAETIAGGLDQAVSEISTLEKRIAANNCTVAAVAQSLAQLDLRDHRTTVETYARLIKAVIDVEQVAIYLAGRDGFSLACVVNNAYSAIAPAQETLSEIQINEILLNGSGAISLQSADHMPPPMKRHIGLIKSPSHEVIAGVVICNSGITKREIPNNQKRLEDLTQALSGILETINLNTTGSSVHG
jgi:hypothetical protein